MFNKSLVAQASANILSTAARKAIQAGDYLKMDYIAQAHAEFIESVEWTPAALNQVKAHLSVLVGYENT